MNKGSNMNESAHINKHYDKNHIYPLIATKRLFANQYSVFQQLPILFWHSVIKSSSAEYVVYDQHYQHYQIPPPPTAPKCSHV